MWFLKDGVQTVVRFTAVAVVANRGAPERNPG